MIAKAVTTLTPFHLSTRLSATAFMSSPPHPIFAYVLSFLLMRGDSLQTSGWSFLPRLAAGPKRWNGLYVAVPHSLPIYGAHAFLYHATPKDCNNHWSRTTFSDIAWFLVASLFAFMFNTFSWGYLHQLLSVGTRLDVGPGVGGAEGRGLRASENIDLQVYAPRYNPPSYPPPRDSAEEDAHLHGVGNDAPKYDGTNAGDYLPGKDEKAPGYEFATSKSGKGFEEDDEGHGPRVKDNNPFQ